LDSLDRLRSEYGLTVLIIEHRLHDLGQRVDRLLVMDRGRIIADDQPERILGQKQFLAQMGIRYGWHVLEEDWSALLPGGLVPTHIDQEQQPLVEMRSVEAGYGRHTILKGIDLTIQRGDFLALVGDNGAGKTTAAKLLGGLLKPRAGQIIWHTAPGREPGRRVGLLLQDPLGQLFCDSVEEEVAFGPRNYGLQCDQLTEEMLQATGLQGLRERRPYSLSSGQQQRTALAAVLALKPELLILDEPTMGQDWRHLSGFMDFLKDLNERGTTILLITHDYKLVCRYARRIAVLSEGRISADGTPCVPLVATDSASQSVHMPSSQLSRIT
jgi:energy-coupling factor transport system ATP-binding protein